MSILSFKCFSQHARVWKLGNISPIFRHVLAGEYPVTWRVSSNHARAKIFDGLQSLATVCGREINYDPLNPAWCKKCILLQSHKWTVDSTRDFLRNSVFLDFSSSLHDHMITQSANYLLIHRMCCLHHFYVQLL